MEKEPKLAPPGAGLPLVIAIIARVFTGPVTAARSNWQKNAQDFDRLNEKILFEIEGIPAGDLEKRILIPPQSGLEDSSRYWSISMTLEHLWIVNEAMMRVMIELGSGRIPEGEVSTAAVKPSGKFSSSQVVENFRIQVKGMTELLSREVRDQNSRVRFRHPWFGPMTAKQWQWVMQAHAGVHLRQIRSIRKGLAL
jgi:hypothetical protein